MTPTDGGSAARILTAAGHGYGVLTQLMPDSPTGSWPERRIRVLADVRAGGLADPTAFAKTINDVERLIRSGVLEVVPESGGEGVRAGTVDTPQERRHSAPGVPTSGGITVRVPNDRRLRAGLTALRTAAESQSQAGPAFRADHLTLADALEGLAAPRGQDILRELAACDAIQPTRDDVRTAAATAPGAGGIWVLVSDLALRLGDDRDDVGQAVRALVRRGLLSQRYSAVHGVREVAVRLPSDVSSLMARVFGPQWADEPAAPHADLFHEVHEPSRMAIAAVLAEHAKTGLRLGAIFEALAADGVSMDRPNVLRSLRRLMGARAVTADGAHDPFYRLAGPLGDWVVLVRLPAFLDQLRERLTDTPIEPGDVLVALGTEPRLRTVAKLAGGAIDVAGRVEVRHLRELGFVGAMARDDTGTIVIPRAVQDIASAARTMARAVAALEIAGHAVG